MYDWYTLFCNRNFTARCSLQHDSTKRQPYWILIKDLPYKKQNHAQFMSRPKITVILEGRTSSSFWSNRPLTQSCAHFPARRHLCRRRFRAYTASSEQRTPLTNVKPRGSIDFFTTNGFGIGTPLTPSRQNRHLRAVVLHDHVNVGTAGLTVQGRPIALRTSQMPHPDAIQAARVGRVAVLPVSLFQLFTSHPSERPFLLPIGQANPSSRCSDVPQHLGHKRHFGVTCDSGQMGGCSTATMRELSHIGFRLCITAVPWSYPVAVSIGGKEHCVGAHVSRG